MDPSQEISLTCFLMITMNALTKTIHWKAIRSCLFCIFIRFNIIHSFNSENAQLIIVLNSDGNKKDQKKHLTYY